MSKKIKNKNTADLDYIPSYSTFPLADSEKVEENSKVSIPSEDDTNEVKDWVDFKEM